MTILATMQEALVDVEEAVQHGAAWLLGAFQIAQKDVQTAEAGDPLLAEAVTMAKTWAVGHGTIVQNVESIGDSILSIAKAVAPAPVPVPAPVAVPEPVPTIAVAGGIAVPGAA